ncbi:hypothetical protein MLD38_007865 [Melastoma candidum]|uniref:Uncharacterized protein n=1 Tax=Melastoma candidum TaxID=119954 RepID=A0ACB9RW70_9MYRT|nr:hypothetical protein MLD38_007865 [Melastoma candidum]
MSFARKDYEFLRDIGISPRNSGCYVNGSWKAHGPLVSTLNPANNQVLLLLFGWAAAAGNHHDRASCCFDRHWLSARCVSSLVTMLMHDEFLLVFLFVGTGPDLESRPLVNGR